MMKTASLIIINELAGGGAMADDFRRHEYTLREVLGSFDLAFTNRPLHAMELTREALLSGKTLIVAGGGDGTVSECVNGFFDEKGEPINQDASLAILPGGTGSDLGRTLGIFQMEDALLALSSQKKKCIDLGKVSFPNGSKAPRYFINVASFGLSGLVDRDVTHFRRLGASLAYPAATVKSLWGWKNKDIHLEFDDGSEFQGRILTVAVGNGQFFGGGMKICPDAALDSGSFSVTILGDLKPLEVLLLSRSLYSGLHIYDPRVSQKRCTFLSAKSKERVLMDLDGEPLGELPAKFELVPKALKILTT